MQKRASKSDTSGHCLLCSVGVEGRHKIHFPPRKVDCYEVDGGKIWTVTNRTIHDEEGRVFKKSKWGQAFCGNVPDDLIRLLDERLAEFRAKSQFYTRDSPSEAFDVGSLSSHRSLMR